MRSVLIALALLLALPVVATATQPQQKLPICHRTASDTNPYVIIRPDSASWYAHLDNHVNHTPKNGRVDFFAHLWSDGQYRCRQEPPPPPPPPKKVWIANGTFGPLCGDPWTFARFNNRRNEYAAVYTFHWTDGWGRHKTQSKSLAPGAWARTKWRWVGLGTTVRITVRSVGLSPAVVKTVRTMKITRWRMQHWNTGRCPAKPSYIR